MSKVISNLSNFTPKGNFGRMFERARAFNQLNEQLKAHLPEAFKSLSLCAIDDNKATFITDSQALAFRAQQQKDVLLEALKRIDTTANIDKIVIKIDQNITAGTLHK